MEKGLNTQPPRAPGASVSSGNKKEQSSGESDGGWIWRTRLPALHPDMKASCSLFIIQIDQIPLQESWCSAP